MAEVAAPPAPPALDSIDTNGDATSSEPVTVFHDASNFNVKHPLMHKWTLWFTKPPTGKVNQVGATSVGPQTD